MRSIGSGIARWLASPERRQALHATAVTMAAVLATFATALLIEHVAHLHTDVIILAVVLAMTLGHRAHAHSGRSRLISLVLLPVVAVLAMEVGTLMTQHATLGDALFVAAVSVGIWLRRFGPASTRAGTLLTLPFIALLITPLPTLAGGGAGGRVWTAVIALVAMGWVNAAQWADQRRTSRARNHEPAAPASAAAGRRADRRLPASTRMAVQMAAALAAAFAVGHWLFPDHWAWLVVTAYIVGSANRGRGDVAYKSILRIAGAAVGTIAATLIAGQFPAGDKTPIVIIFVVLAAAHWLRPLSYAYWAAGMTSVLALLNGYFGLSGTTLLRERLGGIAVGAAIALVAAWVILPIRTTDVVRRRIADALAELTDYLTVARRSPADLDRQQPLLDHAFDQLEQIAPPLRAHRKLPAALHRTGLPSEPHLADAIDSVLAYRVLTHGDAGQLDPGSLKELQQQVIRARRSIKGTRHVPMLPNLAG